MKIFIGADLCPTAASAENFIQGNVQALFGDILSLTATGDRFMVNLECALTERDTAIRKFGPNLKASPRTADTLKAVGITDAFLSNNHVYDFGEQGLRDTLKNLERVGIGYTGIGEDDTDSRRAYVVEGDGRRIAFINVCEHEYCYALPTYMGTNPYNPYTTMHDIREAKKGADFVVVIYHGGKEHCLYPSPRLRDLGHEMIECGADLVLMQHSHCIGCLEEYEGGKILYGQGNFHFIKLYDAAPATWYTALLAELVVTDTLELKLHPIVTTDTGMALARGGRADEIMKAFRARCEELKDGRWRDGWHAFCESVKEPYTGAIARAYTEGATEQENEHFAHYLDCEAHTDVWRELFQTWHRTDKK